MPKTLGLSMIVKNESHVLTRLLNSVSPIIDHWVIVDTGSTDGTQQLIKDYFEAKGIPGQLIEMEWVDFSTCRNVALQETEKHVDYGMWIDADEELVIQSDFNKERMLSQDVDSISITTVYGKIDYTRKNIWKTGKNFKWYGPIHELLASPDEKTGSIASGVYVIVRPEGSSWTNVTQKYLDHAKILEEYTKKDPDPRWIFYTAQSYRDASVFDKSVEWYSKRAMIRAGFIEEIYISKFMVAKLSEATLGKNKTECTLLYQEAHREDPLRGEAIKALVEMYHRHQDWENAYIYSLYGLRYNKNNPYPNRILFLDKALYDYQMMELHAISCFHTKREHEAAMAYWTLRKQVQELGPDYLPEAQMNKILENEQFFWPLSRLSEASQGISAPPFSKEKRGKNYTPPKKKRR